MAYKLYEDEELRDLADRIVAHRMTMIGKARDEEDVRREVYRTVTALAIANRSACMLDDRRLHEIERPDLADSRAEYYDKDTLSSRAAALVLNCVSNTDPLASVDDPHSFAPAGAVSKLIGWAAAADAARLTPATSARA